jgi:hypothetical protein
MAFILNIFSWVVCGLLGLIQKSMVFIYRKYESGLPPFRIQLVRSADVVWSTSKEVRRLRSDLMSAGFTPAGTYDIYEMASTHYMVFCHPGSSVLGVIVGSGRKTWLDVSSVFADGGSIAVSSCEDPGLPQRPGHEVLRVSAPDARAMHEQILLSRGHKPAVPISSDTLAALLEQQYARHMNWLAERGGYTREEICRVILHGKDPNHRDVFVVREHDARVALAHWWQLQPDVPEIDAEHFHDCITIVHDDLLLDSLDYIFSDATGDWDAEIRKVPGRRTPREAFAMLNRMRGEPLVKICEKRTPLKADFYIHRALLEEQEGVAEEFSVRA